MYKLFLVSISFLFAHTTFAVSELADVESRYYEITEVQTELIEQGAPVNEAILFDLDQYADRETSLNDIMNFGKWLWNIVKENEPVLNFKSQHANAIPQLAQAPFNMQNWSAPRSNTYKMSFRNGFGSDVVSFTYKVIYTHNGSYDGRGKYLANVSVHPGLINVSWGFNFSADVEIADILNLGSIEEPHAGMQLNVNWAVESVLKKIRGGDNYFVQGDGDMLEL